MENCAPITFGNDDDAVAARANALRHILRHAVERKHDLPIIGRIERLENSGNAKERTSGSHRKRSYATSGTRHRLTSPLDSDASTAMAPESRPISFTMATPFGCDTATRDTK